MNHGHGTSPCMLSRARIRFHLTSSLKGELPWPSGNEGLAWAMVLSQMKICWRRNLTAQLSRSWIGKRSPWRRQLPTRTDAIAWTTPWGVASQTWQKYQYSFGFFIKQLAKIKLTIHFYISVSVFKDLFESCDRDLTYQALLVAKCSLWHSLSILPRSLIQQIATGIFCAWPQGRKWGKLPFHRSLFQVTNLHQENISQLWTSRPAKPNTTWI